jgi:hypothetical protein
VARGRWMARFARWHIWLGWAVGVPLLLWTASGLVMVARPIEEVRGEHLRIEAEARPIPPDARLIAQLGSPEGVTELTQRMEGDELVAIFTFADGRQSRYSLTRQATQTPLNATDARAVVARQIRGGGEVAWVEFFDAKRAPLDLRKPVPAWRVTLADGTRVYVNRDTGRIEAVRTGWWRFYDFMWGLHIMDLETREDSHNPFVIGFGALALIGALLGTVLLFRRRRARAPA